MDSPNRDRTAEIHLEWYVEAVILAAVLAHIPDVTSAGEEMVPILMERHLQEQRSCSIQ